jgi:hypothetical protein
MIINVLGYKLKVEYILGAVALYFILTTVMVCSCSRIGVVEGMQMMGADVDWKMGNGVPGSWENRAATHGPSLAFREKNHDAYQSKMVSPGDSLDFFAETEFSQDCCGASYSGFGGLLRGGGSTSGGCACLNKQQVDYINQRGGNRTLPTEF